MRQKLLIAMLIAAAGCSDYDTSPDLDPSTPYEPNSDAISFSTSQDNWETKGDIITSSNISEMDIYAYYTAETLWSEANSQSYIVPFMYNQYVGKSNGVWSYSPIKYWPNDNSHNITFYAFAPHGEIEATESESGKPQFSHTLSNYADDNKDLIANVKYDKKSVDGTIDFSLVHTLTRLLLYAQTTGTNTNAESKEEFTINGISLIGLYPTRTLNIDENGNFSWSLTEENKSQDKIEITATQGATLRSKDNYALSNNPDGATTNDKYTIITDESKALLVHPQALLENDIQVQLRIRRTYEKGEGEIEEIIYQTETAYIPTSTVKEWKMGETIAIYFSFDISKLSLYETPLTVSSKVFQWTDADVDIDIHSNLYIYSSTSDIAVEGDTDNGYYGEFMICTNYDYNLRVPHYRVELDNTITSSRGFLFCSNDFTNDATYDVGNLTNGSVSDYKIFIPTLLSGKGGRELVYVTKESLGLNTQTATVTCDDETKEYALYFGQNEYAFIYDEDKSIYRLLYYDNEVITAFNYNDDNEIDLSSFEDSDNTVYFTISIKDGYSFGFSVKRSTRKEEGLYTSTAVVGDDSYGVNKEEGDAVYIQRLSVTPEHLTSGYFNDIIGVEMVSNGGGMITKLFSMILSDSNGVIPKTN